MQNLKLCAEGKHTHTHISRSTHSPAPGHLPQWLGTLFGVALGYLTACGAVLKVCRALGEGWGSRLLYGVFTLVKRLL